MNTNSTLFSSDKTPSFDIDNLTVDDIHEMQLDIEYGINVVRQNYPNEPNFKGKPLFLKFCKKYSSSGHSNYTCPDKRYIKPVDKPNFHRSGVENTVVIQGIEAQISCHNLTQNLITVIVILNHRVEVVHHIRNRQTHRTTIALGHNYSSRPQSPHYNRMEIAQDDRSLVIDFVTSEIILPCF